MLLQNNIKKIKGGKKGQINDKKRILEKKITNGH